MYTTNVVNAQKLKETCISTEVPRQKITLSLSLINYLHFSQPSPINPTDMISEFVSLHYDNKNSLSQLFGVAVFP